MSSWQEQLDGVQKQTGCGDNDRPVTCTVYVKLMCPASLKTRHVYSPASSAVTLDSRSTNPASSPSTTSSPSAVHRDDVTSRRPSLIQTTDGGGTASARHRRRTVPPARSTTCLSRNICRSRANLGASVTIIHRTDQTRHSAIADKLSVTPPHATTLRCLHG